MKKLTKIISITMLIAMTLALCACGSTAAGAVVFEGVDITQKRGPDGKKLNLDLYRQKMGMVFQHFNLFPHKTVLENMTIAPTLVKKADKAAAEAKALELLRRVGLEGRAGAYPAQLSGGQKQRVAIVRACDGA